MKLRCICNPIVFSFAPMSAPSLSPLESAIRATGARVTPARLRVLGLLRQTPTPMSHGEMEDALGRETGPGVDRVTLYRVLDWLVAAGLARKAADARGVFRFTAQEPNGEHARHVHFRCTRCGGVFCLDLPAPVAPALPPGFCLSGMSLDLHGSCPACSATAAAPVLGAEDAQGTASAAPAPARSSKDAPARLDSRPAQAPGAVPAALVED